MRVAEPRPIRAVPLVPQDRCIAILQQRPRPVLHRVKRQQIFVARQPLSNPVIVFVLPRAVAAPPAYS